MSTRPPHRAGFSRPITPITPKPATRLLTLALLAGLAVVAYLVAQRGFAEVIVQQPRYEIGLWSSGRMEADKTRLDAMQAALNEARAIDPRNPRMLEEAAHFHAARVAGRLSWEPGVREERLQSLALLRQMLEQAPTSGHAWASVALLKLQLDETDQVFAHSLQQALRRGPWEPKVQLLAIQAGLGGWQALPDPLREALKQAIRAQARWPLVNQKPALQSLLSLYGRSDLADLL